MPRETKKDLEDKLKASSLKLLPIAVFFFSFSFIFCVNAKTGTQGFFGFVGILLSVHIAQTSLKNLNRYYK